MKDATSTTDAEQNPETRPPVVVITGPTASGKSSLALLLAEKFGGEIINADSMQIFRFMDIGTAKPTAEERGRVPHHLFDVANPDEPYSAGRYAKEAREAAAAIHDRNRPVFLVGGTGLYIRAFLDGLIETGGVVPGLRKRLEEEQARAEEEAIPLDYIDAWLNSMPKPRPRSTRTTSDEPFAPSRSNTNRVCAHRRFERPTAFVTGPFGYCTWRSILDAKFSKSGSRSAQRR